MLPTIAEAPGRGLPPPRARRRALLPAQQRLVISLVSAACGLFVAWLLFGEPSSGGGQRAAAAASHRSQAEALLPFDGSAAAQGGSASQRDATSAGEAQLQQHQQQLQQQRDTGGGGGALPHTQQEVQQLPQQQQQPDTLPAAGAMADEREWYAKLSQAGCRCTGSGLGSGPVWHCMLSPLLSLRSCSHASILRAQPVPCPTLRTATPSSCASALTAAACQWRAWRRPARCLPIQCCSKRECRATMWTSCRHVGALLCWGLNSGGAGRHVGFRAAAGAGGPAAVMAMHTRHVAK